MLKNEYVWVPGDFQSPLNYKFLLSHFGLEKLNVDIESGSKVDPLSRMSWTVDIELFETKMERYEFVIQGRWEDIREPQHTHFLAF